MTKHLRRFPVLRRCVVEIKSLDMIDYLSRDNLSTPLYSLNGFQCVDFSPS